MTEGAIHRFIDFEQIITPVDFFAGINDRTDEKQADAEIGFDHADMIFGQFAEMVERGRL